MAAKPLVTGDGGDFFSLKRYFFRTRVREKRQRRRLFDVIFFFVSFSTRRFFSFIEVFDCNCDGFLGW